MMRSELEHEIESLRVAADALMQQASTAHQAETILRTLVHEAPVLICAVDPSGRMVLWNRECERVTGYTRQQMIGNPNWLTILYPDPNYLRGRVDELQRCGHDFRDWEWQLTCQDGSQRIVAWSSVSGPNPIADWDSWAIGVDVTERRASERALRENEERLRLALGAAQMGTWDWDIATNRAIYSEELGTFFGLAAGSFNPTYEEFMALIHPDDRARVAEAITVSVERGAEFAVDSRVIWPDSSIHWLDSRGRVYRDAEGRPLRMLGVVMDITQRKVAEARDRQHQAELAHAGRLSDIGQMVAGFAHEINQPLYAISNYTEACNDVLQASPVGQSQDLLYWVRQISEQATRAGAVIRGLSNFARKSDLSRSTRPLNEIIREAVSLLTVDSCWQTTQVLIELDEPAPLVHVDLILVEQVVVNVLKNAFEALRESDTEPREVTIRSRPTSDEGIEVSISNTGPGLDPELLEKVFAPFFSTKSNGTGMGLSISRTIVEAHGGRMWATSGDGHGVTFHFTLPTTVEAPQASDLAQSAENTS